MLQVCCFTAFTFYYNSYREIAYRNSVDGVIHKCILQKLALQELGYWSASYDVFKVELLRCGKGGLLVTHWPVHMLNINAHNSINTVS